MSTNGQKHQNPHDPPHPQAREHAGSGVSDGREQGQRDVSNYDSWTRDELYDKAKEMGIEGRSKMSKEQLLRAVRNH